MNYNSKINFKFLEYLYHHCDSKDLHEMHLKNVLNGKEKILNDIDIFILRGKEVLEYILNNKKYNISNIKHIYYLYTKEKIIEYNDIYNKLIDNKNKLIKMGINELFIYGSYARKDYNEYSDLDLLCITNNIFYIDKEIVKTILEAMLNIKVALNIKGHDYYKFITNDMNNEKLRVY